MRQIVQTNSASPHFVGAINPSAKGKEPVESPPTVSRKQLAAESDDLMITFTSSDDEEEEKEEEYSETDIFGPDYSSSDNDIAENDVHDIESSDHDDQEEAQALTAHDDVIAASSVMNDMLDAEQEQMQEEELKTEAHEQDYTEGMKFKFEISPVKLCDHLYDNTVSPEQVYTVLSNTHIDYLVQLQRIMKELFDRLDFEPPHVPQIITYANFINHQVPKLTGSITFWINFVPWSKHAWLWSEFIAAPPDPPDPPDIPEVAAAFADSVSDAINDASRAASALDATSQAQAFALNAASKAASACDYNNTPASAAGAFFYSRCVVPPCCTYLLYSTSLRMPISRIQIPFPIFPLLRRMRLREG